MLANSGCIKERLPVLKGRVPPHRPRGRASTKVYSSKLAPHHGTYDTTVRQPEALSSKLKTHPYALSMPSNIPARAPLFPMRAK
eukprot:1155225-Pelagomonas_calceolata.AAC.2